MTEYGPFDIILPNERWAPTKDQLNKVNDAYEKLLPPLVYKIRKAVYEWRENGYEGASETSKALLNFWFNKEHKIGDTAFKFFFSQREAIESIIYLYEVAEARDKYDLMRFDSSGRVSTGMFDEHWIRYVIKMATGSGKTKVIALALVWSYFHKLYVEGSTLSTNFLLIAPNIIVLNRLRNDFDDLKIFREEPFIPENGYWDRDWENDFQLTVHIQDKLKPITDQGNLFLTNIHRVFMPDETKSLDEEFLGKKPKPDADTGKAMDLGRVLRSDKIKDLVVFNDEAHHIHDPNLAWFKSIEDVSNKLKLKHGQGISLQVDTTATPKHSKGAIFVQTICDYPLVEAIRHSVIKSPVLPDEASREKLQEKDSDDFIERYRDYLHLGYLEWEKQYNAMNNVKTPILFVMANDTNEADAAANFLETQYPKLENSVLTIHTNKAGEIKGETTKSKRDKEELKELRQAANDVDKDESPYKAIVSVLMLREGWDVKNVTTIVGLRPYQTESRILPEQTLGRGLRKMFGLYVNEKLVVVGTSAFIDFVEELKTEGVQFEYSSLGEGKEGKSAIVIEVDQENQEKDLDKLDIHLPRLTSRIYKEYKNLDNIDIDNMEFKSIEYKSFSEEELKEIVFKDIDEEVSHTTKFEDRIPDYRHMIGFFTKNILKENQLVSGFNVLYPKVEQFVSDKLFDKHVELDAPQTIRNLSEIEAKNTIYRAFKQAINDLTIVDKGSAEIRDYIKLKDTKPFPENEQQYYPPKKSIFNKIAGDSQFELIFASFLDSCNDIVSFAKNYRNVHFKIEYQAEDGNISDYYPDFFVKRKETEIYIIETKGREDHDARRKFDRLRQWCRDVNGHANGVMYYPIYIKQDTWENRKQDIHSFNDLIKNFKE